MKKEKASMVLMGLSALATLVAGYVFFTQKTVFDVAGTQWILVAIVLGIYGMYAMHCPCGEGACCGKPEEK